MSATQLDLFDATELEVKPTPTLQSILECLDSIPNINNGGCGIAALAIYRWCKKNGVPVSDRPFVFLWGFGDAWERDNNDELLRNGELDRVEAPSHVVIEVDDRLCDSSGIESEWADTYEYPQEYKLNEAELLNIINRTGEWNPMFRRARHISKIEFGLGISLEDVEA